MDHELTRLYDENLRMLETPDPAHADIFNPLFAKLVNNTAYLKDKTDLFRVENGAFQYYDGNQWVTLSGGA